MSANVCVCVPFPPYATVGLSVIVPLCCHVPVGLRVCVCVCLCKHSRRYKVELQRCAHYMCDGLDCAFVCSHL